MRRTDNLARQRREHDGQAIGRENRAHPAGSTGKCRVRNSRDKMKEDFGIGWSLQLKNVRVDRTETPGDSWQLQFNGGFF